MGQLVISPFSGLILLYSATWSFWFSQTPSEALVISFCAAFPLIWLSKTDLARYEIPDSASLGLACIGIGSAAVLQPENVLIHLMSGLLVFGLAWLFGEVFFRWRGIEGLGIGDAKLLGAGICLLGPAQLPDLLLLSSLGGIFLCMTQYFRKSGGSAGIPFGPFIAYAVFILVLQPSFIF